MVQQPDVLSMRARGQALPEGCRELCKMREITEMWRSEMRIWKGRSEAKAAAEAKKEAAPQPPRVPSCPAH